jgi:uncharacterized protein YodC (DUF2158 family)
MTVVGPDAFLKEMVVCQWFSGSTLQSEKFRPASLVRAEAPQSGG